MITAVDTNVLFDILLEDPFHSHRSKALLEGSASSGSLIISPPVYAELLTQFGRVFPVKKASVELDSFLTQTGISLKPFSRMALESAAFAWTEYTKRRPKRRIQCPKCGSENELQCDQCGKKLLWRNHMITDFLIGGHALALSDGLLTRDRGYYNAYFPNLTITYTNNSIQSGE